MRWMPIVLIIIAAMLLAQNARDSRQTSVASVATERDRIDRRPGPRIFAGGIVEGAHRELTLRFEASGRIKAVYVRQGDAVKAGDVLAELESEIAELNLAEANARLKIVIAERDQLLAGSRNLRGQASPVIVPVADQQFRDAATPIERIQSSGSRDPRGEGQSFQETTPADAAAAQWQTPAVQAAPTEGRFNREQQLIANGRISVAEAAVRREQFLVDRCRLRAPEDGIVLRVTFERGELTGPADEHAELSLANPGTIHVRAFVEELDAMRVRPGQRAEVTAAGRPERSYVGVVRTCSPDVRPKSHRHSKPGERLDVRVREVVIELADAADLLIGLPVEVFIEPADRRKPSQAARRDELQNGNPVR